MQKHAKPGIHLFPVLADALSEQHLGPLLLYFFANGLLGLEYQLPDAGSWCDAVLPGRRNSTASAVIVDLKHRITRGDRPGPIEGLMDRGGQIVLHPADQVQGYTEYCRRFHSALQDYRADVGGCVFFTRDNFLGRYEGHCLEFTVR